MNNIFITITGFGNYYGLVPFKIGSLLLCKKEENNCYDDEAICVSLPVLGTVGYVANSPRTTAGGTRSAGRIYDSVGKHFYARVMFTTLTKAICRLELSENDATYEKDFRNCMESDGWCCKMIDDDKFLKF